jgi:hypothetical protein
LLHSHSTASCVDHTSASSSSTATQSPTIREASFDDYPQIAALQSKYGLETKNYEEWKHLWSNNPAYIEYRAKLPIGWVLEDNHKNICGYLGNIPLFYEFEGRTLLASVAHSWVVDSQFRSYALLLLDRYFSQPIVELFLNATVGPAAAESFAVFQSVPVPVGAWDRSAFRITNHAGFLAGSLRMKGFPFATSLGRLLSVASFVRQGLSKPTSRHDRTGIELQLCTQIDSRFDVFWDALRKRKSHVLLGVRNREVLEWHFKYALKNNKAWIVAVDEGAGISAYSIFIRYDNPNVGLKRMRLVDFQTLDGDTTFLLPMLSWALMRCRRDKIHMLESVGFRPEKQNIITEVAPFERKLPSWLYFYSTRDKQLAQSLTSPDVWDPSQFDGDASL